VGWVLSGRLLGSCRAMGRGDVGAVREERGSDRIGRVGFLDL
jgi:hypothetical protein